MVSKAFPLAILKCASIFILGEIKKALKDENLVEEFKDKFTKYGRERYDENSKKREEVLNSLPNEALKSGLVELLDQIDNRIICYGKEDIDPKLPANTLECIIGAYVKMAILDAIHSYIKAGGDYSKAMDVILYLSFMGRSAEIVEAFRNMYLHKLVGYIPDILKANDEFIKRYELVRYELGGYIPDILEAKKDIDESIKELDRAFKYAYTYIVDAINNLFYNKKEDFLKKIEYGIQLNPYKK